MSREDAIKEANRIGNLFYQGSIFDYNKEGHLEECRLAKERAKICVNELIAVLRNVGCPNTFYAMILEEIDNL